MRSRWHMSQAVLGVPDRVEVTLVRDRSERLGPARPAHQRPVIDDLPVRPRGTREVVGCFLAAEIQAGVCHQAAQRAGEEVQVPRLRRVRALVKRDLNAAERAVHGGEQRERRRADIRAAQPDNLRRELLHGPGTDRSERRPGGVIACLARRHGDHVQPSPARLQRCRTARRRHKSSRHIRKACCCLSPKSATRPAITSSRPPSPSPPPPPKNPTSPRPTSPSSTSPAPAATPSADTAGHSSTPASQTRPPGTRWSACWTGSPTTDRPTSPPPATCPSPPESSNSPAPHSSR